MDGGHVWAISPAVPLRMEGSVKPEHSRKPTADFSESLSVGHVTLVFNLKGLANEIDAELVARMDSTAFVPSSENQSAAESLARDNGAAGRAARSAASALG